MHVILWISWLLAHNMHLIMHLLHILGDTVAQYYNNKDNYDNAELTVSLFCYIFLLCQLYIFFCKFINFPTCIVPEMHVTYQPIFYHTHFGIYCLTPFLLTLYFLFESSVLFYYFATKFIVLCFRRTFVNPSREPAIILLLRLPIGAI